MRTKFDRITDWINQMRAPGSDDRCRIEFRSAVDIIPRFREKWTLIISDGCIHLFIYLFFYSLITCWKIICLSSILYTLLYILCISLFMRTDLCVVQVHLYCWNHHECRRGDTRGSGKTIVFEETQFFEILSFRSFLCRPLFESAGCDDRYGRFIVFKRELNGRVFRLCAFLKLIVFVNYIITCSEIDCHSVTRYTWA